MKLGALLCVLAVASPAWAAEGWELVHIGRGGAGSAVAIHPSDANRIFAVVGGALYESSDGGRAWEERFRLPLHTAATALAVGAGNPAPILIATNRGLYGSWDGGARWSCRLRPVHGTSIKFHATQPQTVLLGTRDGLFLSRDAGRRWASVTLPPAAREIAFLAFSPEDPDRVWLTTARGVFSGRLTDGRWERKLAALPEESAEASEETGAPVDSPLLTLHAVAFDPVQPSTVYVSTSRGLRVSPDEGATWRPVSNEGLASRTMTRLLVHRNSPPAVYAATDRGVARYTPDEHRWTVLAHGLAVSRVHDLAAAGPQLWAATNEGIYRFELTPNAFQESEPPSARELLGNFVHEPSIAQVRDAAIRYAEVHPDKIAAWRRQARLRAVMPKFDVTGGPNLTDYRHWDSGTNPDSLLKGERDLDWGTSITWELGDLIWSDDQTSIDVRSKLMVELRDEIVDQITRTYFERRRLQVALLTDPPLDQHALIDKELRLQELTALIDGLTGGYFSSQLTHHKEGAWNQQAAR